MEQTPYAFKTIVNLSYDEILPKITAALQAAGFGVLTEIDVKAVLKKKIDADFRRYIILGACNPNFAFKALSSEIDIGLMLPCNVIIYEDLQGKTVVAAIDPIASMQAINNPQLMTVATAVQEQLRQVIQSVENEN